jgi:hypothetical protein
LPLKSRKLVGKAFEEELRWREAGALEGFVHQ